MWCEILLPGFISRLEHVLFAVHFNLMLYHVGHLISSLSTTSFDSIFSKAVNILVTMPGQSKVVKIHLKKCSGFRGDLNTPLLKYKE